MSGLYNRDYSIILSDELSEKKRIDDMCKVGKIFQKNPFLLYPKAVRHNLSLFPNNYLDMLIGKSTY